LTFNVVAIVAHLKQEYFGHVIVLRVSASELVLMIMEEAMEGSRPIGAPTVFGLPREVECTQL